MARDSPLARRGSVAHELGRRDLLRDLLATVSAAPDERRAILDFALTYAMEDGRLGATGSIFVGVPVGTGQVLELLLRKENHGGKLITFDRAMEYGRFTPGEGFAGTAFETRETVYSNDPLSDRRYKKFDHLPQLRSLACVPILSGRLAIGVMSIHNGRSKFRPEDIAFIEDIARVAALSIHAYHHEMTLLPTKALLVELLEREIIARNDTATPLALAYFDLDGFGAINKQYGHEAGDQVIKAFAQRLRTCVDTESVLCHLHGDEFAVILKQQAQEIALSAAESICEATRSMPFECSVGQGTERISLTTSVGLAHWMPSMTAASLILKADELSNRAKATGKNRVEAE